MDVTEGIVRPERDCRLQDLHERLVGWWFGSYVEGTELRSVWIDAFRRFDARLRAVLDANPEEEERLMETPSALLLECFEAALADFDHLLATFPHELPDGWENWLPEPPDD